MRISDWSSDVCSSDLLVQNFIVYLASFLATDDGSSPHCRHSLERQRLPAKDVGKYREWNYLLWDSCTNNWRTTKPDRKSVVYGKSVSVRVDIGGRSIIKKKTKIRAQK